MVNVEPVPGVLSTVTMPPSMVQKCLADGEPKTRAAEAPGGRGIGLAERLEQLAELFHVSCRSRCPTRGNRPGNCPSRATVRVSLPLLVNLLALLNRLSKHCLTLVWSEAEAADIRRADHLDAVLILVG